jgi:hypothetical protein
MKTLPVGAVTGLTNPTIRTNARSLLENLNQLAHGRQDVLKSEVGRLLGSQPMMGSQPRKTLPYEIQPLPPHRPAARAAGYARCR